MCTAPCSLLSIARPQRRQPPAAARCRRPPAAAARAAAGFTAAKLFGQGVSYTYDDVIFLPGHINFGAHEVRPCCSSLGAATLVRLVSRLWAAVGAALQQPRTGTWALASLLMSKASGLDAVYGLDQP